VKGFYVTLFLSRNCFSYFFVSNQFLNGSPLLIKIFLLRDPFPQKLKIQVHELSGDKLKIREIVHVDIANDPISAADYRETEDPTK
jgi:hypothetical protein